MTAATAVEATTTVELTEAQARLVLWAMGKAAPVVHPTRDVEFESLRRLVAAAQMDAATKAVG